MALPILRLSLFLLPSCLFLYLLLPPHASALHLWPSIPANGRSIFQQLWTQDTARRRTVLLPSDLSTLRIDLKERQTKARGENEETPVADSGQGPISCQQCQCQSSLQIRRRGPQ
ncbi:hypothetical protein JOB18_043387 [Solea senegalensis]|uniref:Uncharacterized protein n=1 Tax=Solea senegalensis TaxID=28829 RepID=A0AAV6TC45_SOLSE|nr:hypothetical protein JOB18_043387 [Solea senegalensis]